VVLSGNPTDRPCLLDFSNLITKSLSLLECVNIVKGDTDWRIVETNKASAAQWLKENHIKSFYSVTRNTSFAQGGRSALEMSGLGKMQPNMMMIGFKNNWRTNLREAKEYYKVIQSAFDIHLAVGVLRISGGLDISMFCQSPIFDLDQSVSSVNSGLSDLRRLASMSIASQTEPLWMIDEKPKRESSMFGCIGKRSEKVEEVLVDSSGREISDRHYVDKMTVFRGDDEIEGFVDVYWLYDDGGLTLLLPHILTTRKKFSKCKLRIFILAREGKSVDEEKQNMTELLNKFRLNFHQIVMLTDVNKRPGKKIKKEFDEMIRPVLQPKKNAPSIEANTLMLTHSDLARTDENTKFHLRIAEIVREHSSNASLIVMTLPMPTMDESLPFGIYLSWLDLVSKNLPPFLMVRGNQESVLTFYS
jgi:solute carrier family 12 sodium/potassium/chloride transporter 2